MSGHEDRLSSENFLHTLKEKYVQIYNKLSSDYDPEESAHSMEGYDPHLVQVAGKIEKMFGINHKIILKDFKYKMKNLGIISDELIPTFYVRFSIEEGAWSVIERVTLREMLTKNLSKLLLLEKQIWVEKSANPEDAIFYLLEMKEFGATYLRSFVEYWRLEHIASDVNKFIPYFAVVLVNTYINRGHEIVEGAIRILNSKAKDFIGMNQGSYTTNWFTSALEYIDRLNNDLEEYNQTKKVSTELFEAILVQVLLQTEIRKLRRGPTQSQDEFQKRKSILDTIEWKTVDVSSKEGIDNFKNRTLSALLVLDNEDPMQQVFEMIDILFKGENIQRTPHFYKEKIRKEVGLQKGLNATSILPKAILDASIVKNALDKVLIQLKKDLIEEEKESRQKALEEENGKGGDIEQMSDAESPEQELSEGQKKSSSESQELIEENVEGNRTMDLQAENH